MEDDDLKIKMEWLAKMREKIERGVYREIIYDEKKWQLLQKLRMKATSIMAVLENNGIKSYVYGSVARGDVSEKSDIDIVILNPPPLVILNYVIENNFNVYSKEIVQATPNHALKGYVYLDEKTVISFPITKLTKREYEFYYFGGLLSYEKAKDWRIRTPGVNKKLLMIIPKEFGHIEYSIIGRESEVSKILGISIETVLEREKILTRRDAKGRTGVFIKRILARDESFDEVIRELIDKNPAVRNLIRRRGLVI